MRELTLIAGMLLAGCGGGTEVTGDGTTDAGIGGLPEETGGSAAGREETETGGIEETGGASTGGAETGGAEVCPIGTETCQCYGNDTCQSGLTCFSGLCVDAGTGGAGTGGVAPTGGMATGGAVPTGGVAAETGGVAAGGAPVACTWETSTILPSSDEYAQIPADSCLQIGPSDDGERILLIAIAGVDFDFIRFEYSYLEGEEECGPDYHAGLYLAQPLEMPGCTALVDMQGDPDLTIGFRWYQ